MVVSVGVAVLVGVCDVVWVGVTVLVGVIVGVGVLVTVDVGVTMNGKGPKSVKVTIAGIAVLKVPSVNQILLTEPAGNRMS